MEREQDVLSVLNAILGELKKLTKMSEAAEKEREQVIEAKMRELERPMDSTPWGRTREERRVEAMAALAAPKEQRKARRAEEQGE